MKKITAIAGVVMLLLGSGYAVYRYYFPMGIDHRCDKLLFFVLQEYAQKHNGAFPSGEATPEASMSLVHSLDSFGNEYAYLLYRRGVPVDAVRQTLQAGQLLDPDTCGWHYVEDLRRDSNPRLALFWDKEGLGHNGQRLSGGGHVVTFVSGSQEHITDANWPDFVAEQRRLLAEERSKQK